MACLLLLFFLALTYACAIDVDLGYASYRGHSSSNGVSQWLGMRYAAAPVGNLRFEAPRDPAHVEGIQDASRVC